jgi:DNA topoisomerase VI subunit B
VDNALDACEEGGVAPDISVTLDLGRGLITITDNGPGIPPETVLGVLDFERRVSNREAYVAPDRGAQGNALKTLIAMPFVLNGERGEVTIRARGVEHRITVKADHVRQQPVVDHQQRRVNGKTGTSVTVYWPDSACLTGEALRVHFLQIAESFGWLNPHLTLSVRWGRERFQHKASDPGWTKWRPSDPTCPHWYQPDHLARLIGAYVAHDANHGRERTIREFVSEFRGLSGSVKQKAVLNATALARAKLSDLTCDGRLDMQRIGTLLDAMKKQTRPVKPRRLGVIGEEHFKKRFEAVGCELKTFKYQKQLGEAEGVPYVLEFAFGYCPDLDALEDTVEEDEGYTYHANVRRRLVTGVNWSPGIVNPFRQLGALGKSCDTVLAEQRIALDDPVILVLHCAYPRVEFADRGKSSIYLKDDNDGQ